MTDDRAFAATLSAARAGDPDALQTLGLSSPDQIYVVEGGPSVFLYVIEPGGQAQRLPVETPDEAHALIHDELGTALRLNPRDYALKSYTPLIAARPGEEPNPAASAAVGLHPYCRTLRGRVMLVPNFVADPSDHGQRLEAALSGDRQAAEALGLRFDPWAF